MVSKGGSGRCEYVGRGQAGDTLRLLSPMPTHQEPLATPIMAVGRFPPGSPRLGAPRSQPPVRFGALRWGAGRGRARGPGDQRGPGGRRDWGEGPGPPPPSLCPPCPPPRSSRLGGKNRRSSLRALPALRTAPTCRVLGGAPSPDSCHFSSFGNLPPSSPRLGQAALGLRDRAPSSQLVICRRPPSSPRSNLGTWAPSCPESLGLGAMAKSSSLNIRVVEGRALPAKDV